MAQQLMVMFECTYMLNVAIAADHAIGGMVIIATGAFQRRDGSFFIPSSARTCGNLAIRLLGQACSNTPSGLDLQRNVVVMVGWCSDLQGVVKVVAKLVLVAKRPIFFRQ